MLRIGIDCRKIADYGIGTYIRGLLTGFAQLPDEVELILFAPAAAAKLIPPDSRFTHVANEARLYSLGEVVSLGRAAAAARLHVLHMPHYVTPVTRVKLVTTIHDLIHLGLSPLVHPAKAIYARVMMRRAAEASARILTVTGAVGDEIGFRYPHALEKIAVIPNGVDAAFFEAPEGIDERLGRLGLPRGRYFLFVGNDKPHKNLDRLVAAFRQLRGSDPSLGLAIVGPQRKRFQHEEGVVETGFIASSDLAAAYRGALALVQPSLREGFGLPVVEAMASGTPVIVSTAAALVEVAGPRAPHIDPLSVDSIAGAMAAIARDGSLRERLARESTDRARRFSWVECARATMAVYREVAS